MSRLVRPISKEEFEKLPRWQRWVSNNALWLVPLVMALVVGVGVLLSRI